MVTRLCQRLLTAVWEDRKILMLIFVTIVSVSRLYSSLMLMTLESLFVFRLPMGRIIAASVQQTASKGPSQQERYQVFNKNCYYLPTSM
jgi:hypothetical protein